MAKTELTVQERHERELAKARRRGRYIGWIQGGAATAIGLFAWQFIGLIPVLAIAALAIYVVYRLVFASGEPADD